MACWMSDLANSAQRGSWWESCLPRGATASNAMSHAGGRSRLPKGVRYAEVDGSGVVRAAGGVDRDGSTGTGQVPRIAPAVFQGRVGGRTRRRLLRPRAAL